jgi:oxygen-independent coproporphyrinogen-3 oxidase
LRGLGFNRVSFGIQDFDPVVQKAVNRVQPAELNREVVRKSRELDFESINIDLIYGLPHQTEQSFSKSIDHIIDISPDRLAVFHYAHVPWLKPHQKAIPEAALPNAEERVKIKIMVIEKLTKAGYVYIGMDHFAKPKDSLSIAMNAKTLHRNFQGYTTHSEAEIIAMGMTSISQLHHVYAQNAKTEREYMEKLDRDRLPTHIGYRLSEDDQLRRYVITELMCNNRLFKGEVEAKFGVGFDTYFHSSLEKLDEFAENQLLNIFDDRLEITDKGRFVSRNIAMAFDPYLEKADPNKPAYSRTV